MQRNEENLLIESAGITPEMLRFVLSATVLERIWPMLPSDKV
jgi:hypothetical protein